MMTVVVVVPSLDGLLVGCMLLLTGEAVVVVVASRLGGIGCVLLLAWTVLVVVIVPLFEEGVVLAEVDAVQRDKTNPWHYGTIHKNMWLIGTL